MAESKKSHRRPTRRQPRRATKDAAQISEPKVGDVLTPRPSASVRKPQGKSRAATTRQRKKFQQALIKKVDARDPEEAWVEQAHLLGLSNPPLPTSPTLPKKNAQLHNTIKEPKYMDDVLNEKGNIDEEIHRGKRWIPGLTHRKRPVDQPLGVPFALWIAYKHLDDYMYRHSLSDANLKALPLLEDVHRYQDSDGRLPRPITPPGCIWDENLELVPAEE
ncbi:hypothetical protein NPX13_g7912 [Xylaria arbuscula]|uniref:Uncharacterized protein n=1 Tax=Xylaria arbuscula TaxID=114810 RepID=A0A9W8TIU0_9PEZI|nr:hypothetical protein NPX13_g7912 [Xylaria arbuscula]